VRNWNGGALEKLERDGALRTAVIQRIYIDQDGPHQLQGGGGIDLMSDNSRLKDAGGFH